MYNTIASKPERMNLGFESKYFPLGQVWKYEKGRELNRPAWSYKLVTAFYYISAVQALIGCAWILYCFFVRDLLACLVAALTTISANVVICFLGDYFHFYHVYLVPRHVFMEAMANESTRNLNNFSFEEISKFFDNVKFPGFPGITTNHLIKVNVACLRFYRYTFVSHRWEDSANNKPDSENGRQANLIFKHLPQTMSDKFITGKFEKEYQTPTLYLLRNWLDLVGMVDFVWLDYMCVPQDKEASKERLEQICLFRSIAENATSSIIIPRLRGGATSLNFTDLSEGDFKDYICRGWCLLEFMFLPKSNRTILHAARNGEMDAYELHRNVLERISPTLSSDAFNPKMAKGLWNEEMLTVGDEKDCSMLEFNLRDRLTLTQKMRVISVLIVKFMFDHLRYLFTMVVGPIVFILGEILNWVWVKNGQEFIVKCSVNCRCDLYFILHVSYTIFFTFLAMPCCLILWICLVSLDGLAREVLLRLMDCFGQVVVTLVRMFNNFSRSSVQRSIGDLSV